MHWPGSFISLRCWGLLFFRSFRAREQSHSNRLMDNSTWCGILKTSSLLLDCIALFNFFVPQSITYEKRLVDECRTTGLGYTTLCFTGLAVCWNNIDWYILTTHSKTFNAVSCSRSRIQRWQKHSVLISSSSQLHKTLYFRASDIFTVCYL